MPIKRDRNRERFAQKPIDESHTWLLSDSTVQIVKKKIHRLFLVICSEYY